jgi:hypothetical protein
MKAVFKISVSFKKLRASRFIITGVKAKSVDRLTLALLGYIAGS